MIKNNINIEKVIIRFVGDSGDGIQLIGNQMSNVSVIGSKNNICTFIDIPAEIRAPVGSLSGVSGFQLSIANKIVYFVEDRLDLLVVMNPAGLKTSLHDLKRNGILIVDIDTFTDKNLKKAGYINNPLFDGSLDCYDVIKIPIISLTYNCVKDIVFSVSAAKRCKNFFVLGIVYWLYDRKLYHTIDWIKDKFKNKKEIFLANKAALLAGYNYGDILELLPKQYYISPVALYDGYNNVRKISGNVAFSLGVLIIAFMSDLPVFSANYPITPATDVWDFLVKYVSDKIKIIQVEDEIAAIMSVIGASYGGALSFTCTSGPGLDLMEEGLGLAIMAGLPLLLLNIQRSGPSTGMPTKSEQTDLLASIFGRHGEGNVVVLAPNSPSNCFWSIIEGFFLAIKHGLPVIILSDSNLANNSELWTIPTEVDIKKAYKVNDWKTLIGCFGFVKNKNINSSDKDVFLRCIGGLERDERGFISYDPINHFNMVKKRHEKFCSVLNDFNSTEIMGCISGRNLIITWGSVFGIVKSVCQTLIKNGYILSMVCLRYLYPLPKDLNNIINGFEKVIVVEENMGQLKFLLSAEFLVNIIKIVQVTGKPFKVGELRSEILKNI